jgi:hypothetical protein
MSATKKLWWGIVILVLLSPLGLLLPELFQSGPAWGEWGMEELGKMLGFLPEGFKKITDLWLAPLPDYNVRDWVGKGFLQSSLGYILSGVLGVGIIVVTTFLLGKILTKKK